MEALAAAAERLRTDEGNAVGRFGACGSIYRHHSEGSNCWTFLLGEGSCEIFAGRSAKARRHARWNSLASRPQPRQQSERGALPVSHRRTRMQGGFIDAVLSSSRFNKILFIRSRNIKTV